MSEQLGRIPDGSATAKVLDYSLKRWTSLTRHDDDGDLPADKNRMENQTRPVAVGRSNWLFAGSLRAGRREAAVMTLLHSGRVNGLDPWQYLKLVMQCLPTHPAARIAELLPWNAQTLLNAHRDQALAT